MKLSYFTGNWPDLSWNEHCDLAGSMGLSGLEFLYSAAEAQKFLNTTRSAERQQFIRRLGDNKLSISCITIGISSEDLVRNTTMKKPPTVSCLPPPSRSVCLSRYRSWDVEGERAPQ